MATKPKPTAVRVTRRDLRVGEAGDCCRCAAALAIQRATRDDGANVYERDWTMWVEAHGRHAPAPPELRGFVRAFDGLPRADDGRAVLPDPLPDELKPFAFTLPAFDEWQERCYHCEELSDPTELDDDGVCPECQKADAAD